MQTSEENNFTFANEALENICTELAQNISRKIDIDPDFIIETIHNTLNEKLLIFTEYSRGVSAETYQTTLGIKEVLKDETMINLLDVLKYNSETVSKAILKYSSTSNKFFVERTILALRQ